MCSHHAVTFPFLSIFNKFVCVCACAYVCVCVYMRSDQAVVELMVSPKGMKEVVRTITTFPGERDVITSCCKYLRSLTGLGKKNVRVHLRVCVCDPGVCEQCVDAFQECEWTVLL